MIASSATPFAFNKTAGSAVQTPGFEYRRLASRHVADPATIPSVPSPFVLPMTPFCLLHPVTLDLGLKQSSGLRFFEAGAVERGRGDLAS